MTAPPPALPPPRRLLRFGLRGLQTVGLGIVVAVCLSAMSGQSFPTTLVYSVCIALGCWFFIDSGRMLLARWVKRRDPPAQPDRGWPGWGWMTAVLPLGTLAGYGLGDRAAAWLLGHRAMSAADFSGRSVASIVVLSLIPGVVATYFFYSRERLAASNAQAEQAERLAAEQRLQLLASQLEPHMLFNTLANLRALIGVDPVRAQAMLDRLIDFLRATLSASRASTHPLADEFARLADYLALMQIRMGARLQTELSLPSDLAARAVPVLLLQPLVENAIRHGLEPHVDGGRIDVSAAREGAQLVLRVRDNGAGLAPGAGQAGGAGFGLEQVRERLAALYGSAASLELAPATGGGTLATLSMPL